MAAVVDVQEGNGAAVTWNLVTAARFCTADDPAPAATNPIPIPAAGTNRSYWKSHAIAFSGAFTNVTNVKIYTDGVGFGSGCIEYIGVETLTLAQYAQATGTPGTTGNEMVASHANIASKQLLFAFTSTSPKTVDAGPITSGRCKHVVTQLDVDPTAAAGTKTAETITWRYDET